MGLPEFPPGARAEGEATRAFRKRRRLKVKAVRMAANAKGRSISGSAPKGSPADIPRPTNRAVSTRAWKPEQQHTVSLDAAPLHLLHP